MDKCRSAEVDMQEIYGKDLVTEGIRSKVGELIRVILDTELDEAIKAVRYAHSEERAGYRNGSKERNIYSGFGCTGIKVPRGRIGDEGGKEHEWQSKILPRYKRRTNSIDAAVVSLYFSGTNLGRIQQAIKPLVGEAPLSKSVISRLVYRIKEHLDEWRNRDLSKQEYVYLYLDAKNLKAKVLKQVKTIPVLVALGVRIDGSKEVLAMEGQLREKAEAWLEVLEGLARRGMNRPQLVIVDGHRGLRNAVEETWPKILVQRCTVHKLRNIQQYTPVEVYCNVKADYQQIVQAEDLQTATDAYKKFVNKYKEKLPKVVTSLEEAGEELLTFYRFPHEQYKSLKTTNPIERLNLEFERRVKTQCSLPSEESAIMILFGLIISGQIKFHKIRGWQKIPEVRQSKELKKCA